MSLVNAKEMIRKAKEGHYAVGHFNLNNMEFVRAFLLAAEEKHSPIILGVSGGTAKYMGGYHTITDMVSDFIDYLGITVPVALHVDHGTFEQALDAIQGGFTSIMFDGSSLPIEENAEKTKYIVSLCRKKNISVEAEVGAIGNHVDVEEIKMGELAEPEECAKIAQLGIDMLAAGIGNIHGKYPEGWKGLDFNRLAEIQKVTNNIPLVLHGGSGIPSDMVQKAISLGVCKVNVNTECQVAFTEATKQYFVEGKDLLKNGFTPRAMLHDGLEAAKSKCIEKMELFGSIDKA